MLAFVHATFLFLDPAGFVFLTYIVMADVERFDSVNGFLNMLISVQLTMKQRRSILGKLSRLQRLAIVEILTNIVYCNLEPSCHSETEKLLKHEAKLKKIVLAGKRVDNDILKRNHTAVVCALKVGLNALSQQQSTRPSTPDSCLSKEENCEIMDVTSDDDSLMQEAEETSGK